MAVRAGVGLGDREHHLLARAQSGEPTSALLVGAEAGQQLSRDAGGHEQEEQRATLGRRRFAHHDEVAQTAAAPAVGLGKMDREEAGRGQRVPELLGASVGTGLLAEPVVPEARRDIGDRGAEHRVLVALAEVHLSSNRSRRA
jgi:hypothetical protein